MTEDPRVAMLLAQENWNAERRRLREIVLSTGLEERIRWGKLCYATAGNNVSVIFALKAYCAVGFFKGALLDDSHSRLIAPGKHSQAMRQMRFHGLAEIENARPILLSYLVSAIRLESNGARVDFRESPTPDCPDELRNALDDDLELAKAFAALTPGRQRGYMLHVSGAKQSKTRQARIQRCRERILAGKGLNERPAR